jgi:hypothetical protein
MPESAWRLFVMIWPGSPAEAAELVGLLEAGAHPPSFSTTEKVLPLWSERALFFWFESPLIQ